MASCKSCPACGGATNNPCLLPNGQPNLDTDETDPSWSTSVFNPSINTEIGIGGFADNRAQVVAQFRAAPRRSTRSWPSATMPITGAPRSCTVYNTDYTNLVLSTYHMYAMAAGYKEHPILERPSLPMTLVSLSEHRP